jgi:lipid-A-disaccharide synthase
MQTLFFSAGDASGDLHAAAMIRSLLARRPDCHCVGLGGSAMREAGVEIVADQRDIAVGGIFELAGSLLRVARTWRRITAALDHIEPDLVVLVDSGGFNLPLARRIRARTRTPILYYVAPQVWAWRRRRIQKLAQRVDRLALILPFEAQVYAETNVRADFVGHPLVDVVARYAATTSVEQARARIGRTTAERIVALMPGSRRNEIAQHLPIQLECARLMHGRDPVLGFVLAVAPSIEPTEIANLIRSARLPASLRLEIVRDGSLDVLRAARVALVKPGTVTVEAMLLGCPMVVMGRVNRLTALIVRYAIRIPWFAMPNLIAEHPIVPELLQDAATPESLAKAVFELLEGPARERQCVALAVAAERLGAGGASEAASKIVEEMLSS